MKQLQREPLPDRGRHSGAQGVVDESHELRGQLRGEEVWLQDEQPQGQLLLLCLGEPRILRQEIPQESLERLQGGWRGEE
jgi:hypothetical protein